MLLDRLRYRRLMRRLAGPRLLRAFADQYPSAFFVEIGANDGEQHDHLRPLLLSRQWRGILVEPVPYVFARLRANYEELDRVALENVAIASENGRLPFWHLEELPAEERDGVPDWYDAIGSFSREAVLSHVNKIEGLERRLVRTDVPTLTFDALLARHGVTSVELVVIDTEGSDWMIIQHIDLDAHRPRLLIYEHFHLRPEERVRCAEHLLAHGYETMEEGFDTFALDVAHDDALSRCWARLSPAVAGVSAHEGA